MKLLFCSKYSGQTGTTSNLSVIAAYLAYRYPLRIFLMQSQFGRNTLDEAMMGSDKEDTDTRTNGIDMLIRMIKSEPVSKEMIDSCSVNLYHEKLHFLPSSMQQDAAMYGVTIQPALIYCMNAIGQYYDITMVDVGRVHDWERQPLMKQADYVVMNLSQNQKVIEESIRIAADNKKKVFYLIGNYDPLSKYNVKYIAAKYKIPAGQIGVVPYNTMFRDAYSEGTTVKFVSLIEHSTKDEFNHYFDHTMEETTAKMIKFCRIPTNWGEQKAVCDGNRNEV